MQLNELSRIQKRIIDWDKLIATCPREATTAACESLQQLKRLVSAIWQAGAVSSADAAKLSDLERRMEQFSEELRVLVPITAH